jgi:ABC-type transporter lipoprotein component MlaA
MACDALLNPLSWFVPFWGSLANGGVNIVNARARADKQIESARRSALDYYVFVRDAYIQMRDNAVRDSAPPSSGTGYDLYDTGATDLGVYDLPEEPKQNSEEHKPNAPP